MRNNNFFRKKNIFFNIEFLMYFKKRIFPYQKVFLINKFLRNFFQLKHFEIVSNISKRQNDAFLKDYVLIKKK